MGTLQTIGYLRLLTPVDSLIDKAKKMLSIKGRQRKPVTGAMHCHVARPTS